MDDLHEDERVIAAATAGPWYTVESPWRATYRGENLSTYVVAGNPDPHIGIQILEAPEVEEFDEASYEDQVRQTDADLAFACRARTRYPALVQEVRELRALLEQAERVTLPFLNLRDKGEYVLGVITQDHLRDLEALQARLRAIEAAHE